MSGSRQKGSNKKPSLVKHVYCIVAKSSKTARINVGKVRSSESNMLLDIGANMSMVNAQYTPQLPNPKLYMPLLQKEIFDPIREADWNGKSQKGC